MNRLRVRVELNRRRPGVPMEELVSVVEETRKFFQLLAEDVQIETGRGEWLASNFDAESLTFTAEYDGPTSDEQIRAFGSAFGGTTSLRRETIAQFTRIADFIGEDELVGFGLYQSDQESEPSDWRCLSRRDALRFADEIQLLAKAAGASVGASPMPAVMNGSVAGRRLFKDRHERDALATDPTRWIRDVESSLSRRIGLIEGKVETLHESSPQAVDERFLKLLGAMETFWSQAPRQLMLPAPEPLLPKRSRLWWRVGLVLAAAALAVAGAESSELKRQWLLWTQVDSRPVLVSYAPPAPVLPTRAELIPRIPLEIPAAYRSLIDTQVLVNVRVGLDQAGKVATAEIAWTNGEGSDLLAAEALKAARWFRFRPDSQIKNAILTFVFNP